MYYLFPNISPSLFHLSDLWLSDGTTVGYLESWLNLTKIDNEPKRKKRDKTSTSDPYPAAY
jgi:hypothetical protein